MTTPTNQVEQYKQECYRANTERDERIKFIKTRIYDLQKELNSSPSVLLFKRDSSTLTNAEKQAKETARPYYAGLVNELESLQLEDKSSMSYAIEKRLHGGLTTEQSNKITELEQAERATMAAVEFQNEVTKLVEAGLTETVAIAYLTNNQKENR